MLNQKGIAPVIIAAIAIVLAGVGFAVYQSTNYKKAERSNELQNNVELSKNNNQKASNDIIKKDSENNDTALNSEIDNKNTVNYNCKISEDGSNRACINSDNVIENYQDKTWNYSYTQLGDNKTYAVIDGVKKKAFDGHYYRDYTSDFYSSSFCIDRNFSNYVYSLKNDTNYYAIWNDKQYGPYSRMGYGCAISRDGKNVFWYARNNGHDYVYKNGKIFYEIKGSDEKEKSVVLIDPNLEIIIYRSAKDGYTDSMYYFYRNGKEKVFTRINNISYYQNFSKLFFWASLESGDGSAIFDQDLKTVNGRDSKPLYAVGPYVFSPNLKHLIIQIADNIESDLYNHWELDGVMLPEVTGLDVTKSLGGVSCHDFSKLSFFIGREDKNQTDYLLEPNFHQNRNAPADDYIGNAGSIDCRIMPYNGADNQQILLTDSGDYALRAAHQQGDIVVGNIKEYVIHNGRKYGPYDCNAESVPVWRAHYMCAEKIKIIGEDIFYDAYTANNNGSLDWKIYKNGAAYKDYSPADWDTIR